MLKGGDGFGREGGPLTHDWMGWNRMGIQWRGSLEPGSGVLH